MISPDLNGKIMDLFKMCCDHPDKMVKSSHLSSLGLNADGFLARHASEYVDYRALPHTITHLVDPEYVFEHIEEMLEFSGLQAHDLSKVLPIDPSLLETINWKRVTKAIFLTSKDGRKKFIFFNRRKAGMSDEMEAFLRQIGYKRLDLSNEVEKETWRDIQSTLPPNEGLTELPPFFEYEGGIYVKSDVFRVFHASLSRRQKIGQVPVRYNIDGLVEDTLAKSVIMRALKRIDGDTSGLFEGEIVKNSGTAAITEDVKRGGKVEIRGEIREVVKTPNDECKRLLAEELARIKELPSLMAMLRSLGLIQEPCQLIEFALSRWSESIYVRQDYTDAHADPKLVFKIKNVLVPNDWVQREQLMEQNGLKRDKMACDLLEAIKTQCPGQFGLKVDQRSLREAEYYSPYFQAKFAENAQTLAREESDQASICIPFADVCVLFGLSTVDTESVLCKLAVKSGGKIKYDGKVWIIDSFYVKEELRRLEAPGEWMCIEDLSREYEVPVGRLKQLLARRADLRDKGRDFFHPQSGQTKRYFSLDVIDQIMAAFQDF